ncbi:MAG TPA: twin-arginine translocase subunit TatC, partial [Microcoleaceae bacterium UBA10368]|nr:twin-arginine translocase subunit TatC [Microcoleaceae cyanobacterium UBA10368]
MTAPSDLETSEQNFDNNLEPSIAPIADGFM